MKFLLLIFLFSALSFHPFMIYSHEYRSEKSLLQQKVEDAKSASKINNTFQDIKQSVVP